MIKQKQLVPKRRFEGYLEEWKENRLGEVVQITMGQSPNSKNYTDNPTDYILVQGNADMKNNRVFPRVWTRQVTKKADKDDIILSVRAPVGDIGKTDYDVVLGRGVAGIKGNDFIFQLLMKMKKNNYWSNLSTGSTFESINSNDIKEALVFITEEEEQQKIGKFFKHLDEMIALEQRKIDKTKSLKSAYLAEMFPAEGERIPKRRFAGFTDEWRELKLSDLGEFKSNGVNKKINQDEKPIALLNYMDVYARKKINKSNLNELMQVTATDNEILENNIEKNDVFFTPTSETADDIGRVMVIEEDLPGVVYSYHLMRFRPNKNEIYSVFPNYAFSTNYVRKQMEILAQGVQRFVLNRDAFENIKVLLPSYLEQQKIGDFFNKLDNRIMNHQNKLKKLKATKQAYLHEMFV